VVSVGADREPVKTAPFEYRRPLTLEEAVAALGEAGHIARVLAGGQSLIPLMTLRLVRPTLVVDINNLPGLAGIRPTGEGLHIGALTRHQAVETALLPPPFDLLSAAASHVGSVPIRTRGTFGGSIAHADPAAELPLAAIVLDGRLDLRGPEGERSMPIGDFLVGPFRTAAARNEIITRIVVPPAPERARWSFEETNPLKVVAAVVVDTGPDGRCAWARIGLAGIGIVARRCRPAEEGLIGTMLDGSAAASAGAAAAAELHARTGKTHLAHLGGVLVRRAVEALDAEVEGRR
jgi:aerobic carbon-monoxide dehydrogenase medium subunit